MLQSFVHNPSGDDGDGAGGGGDGDGGDSRGGGGDGHGGGYGGAGGSAGGDSTYSVQMSPTSSEWPQLCDIHALREHSSKVASVPTHWRSSIAILIADGPVVSYWKLAAFGGPRPR